MTVLEQLMIDKSVIKGRITSVVFDKSLNTKCLVTNFEKNEIVIPQCEVDIEKTWENLDGFIGRELSFILIKNGEKNIGSRVELQKEKRELVLDKLKNQEVLQGTIINILKYGAYVEIEGVLTALIKNNSFADQFIAIKEVCKKGDKIDVVLKKGTNEKKLLVEAVNKYKADVSTFFNSIEVGQQLRGKVKTLRPDKCFVNLAPGVDGLSSVPLDLDIEEDATVIFEVRKKDPDTMKIRGKVKKVCI